MTPAVSVLLTTYNRPDMLTEAIGSVFGQDYDDYELIILDDNSPPKSGVGAVLDAAESAAPQRVRVWRSDVTPQQRPQKVRYAVLANVGLSLARGRYVTYLCDDDLYLPWRLRVMTDRLEAGDCQVVYGGQQLQRAGQVMGQRPSAHVLEKASCVVDHSSVMHTLAAGLEVGGWDQDPANWNQADAVFWDRLTAAGHLFYRG